MIYKVYMRQHKLLFSSVLWQHQLKALRFYSGSDWLLPTKPLLPMAQQSRPVVPSAHMADTLLLQNGCQNRTSSSSSCRNSERMLWSLNRILRETKSLLEHQQKDHLRLNSLVLVLSYLSAKWNFIGTQEIPQNVKEEKSRMQICFFLMPFQQSISISLGHSEKLCQALIIICEKLQNINHSNF